MIELMCVIDHLRVLQNQLQEYQDYMTLEKKYQIALTALRFYALKKHTMQVFDSGKDMDIEYLYDRGEVARHALDELVEAYSDEEKTYVGPY